MQPRDVERRSAAFVVAVVLVFVLLGLRLGELQIVMGQHYEDLSQGNRLRLLPVVAPRGEIYDRSGQVLATNRPAFSVSLLHMGVEELDRSLTLLSELLDMAPEQITERIDAKRGRWYEPILLRSDVSQLTHTRIEEHRLDLPGVVVEPLPVRDYPLGELAAHAIGYLGEIDPLTLERLADLGYRSGAVVGKMGLEQVYDRYLRGIDGGSQVEVDARGRPFRVLGRIEPIPGNDVFLTLDAKLQAATELALDQAMQALQEHPTDPMPNARISAAVALDPRTGAILAIASRPAFDPNLFATGISSDDWRRLESDPLLPLLNRALQGEYQPGSSFKMITVITALETNRVGRSEVIDCQGGVFHVTPRDVKLCWAARYGGHGRLDLVQAIGQSCNVVMYELGRRVGVDDLGTYSRMFALGSTTGLVDLPGERAGLVPSRAWKRDNFPNEPQWWLSETLDAAIGQGFHMYTPLQLATYAAMLGNGGIHYRPYMVERVLTSDGEILLSVEPEELSRATVSEGTLDLIREGMLACTRPGGTAASWFSDFPIPVAGKTGTVEFTVAGKDNHAWFVGFAPADDPTIAVAVIVEHGGGGGRAAAPVARRILEAYFGT